MISFYSTWGEAVFNIRGGTLVLRGPVQVQGGGCTYIQYKFMQIFMYLGLLTSPHSHVIFLLEKDKIWQWHFHSL